MKSLPSLERGREKRERERERERLEADERLRGNWFLFLRPIYHRYIKERAVSESKTLGS